jgi:hypothetical protein
METIGPEFLLGKLPIVEFLEEDFVLPYSKNVRD